MSPPSHTASNNPFLDDISSSSNSGDGTKPPGYPVDENPSSKSYPTAREEKERLRERFREEADIDDTTTPSGDLPPSYDEVAGSRKPRTGYPKEKESSAARRSHRHRRHREEDHERSHRHRNSGSSSKEKSKSKSAVTPKNVDTIDKMDVTGLFGGSFHHDGPFDACTPHRNKNSKAAPVLAFPADGPNNSIGGASAKKSTLNEVFGREEPDDDDGIYNAKLTTRPMALNSPGSSSTLDAIKPNTKGMTQFDAKGKSQEVHGPTTVGLGSTTFLDGAPASTAAIKDDIKQHSHHKRTGVQRKKSLTQRLHVNGGTNNGIHRSDSGYNSSSGNRNNLTEPLKLAKTHSGHLENGDEDEDNYIAVRFDESSKKESTGNKLLRRVKSLKVGRKT